MAVYTVLFTPSGNLDAFSDEEKELFPAADSGIPQGGVLSPMLANFYLYPFDKAMMDAGFNLVRYADDFVVMCKTQQEAEAAYTLSKHILETRLHLGHLLLSSVVLAFFSHTFAPLS